MAIEGKVRTLYTDKTQQEAIFPTTKVSAVTDDEGNGLNTLLEHIAYVDPMDMESAAVLANADTLGGYPASDYAFAEDLKNLKPEDIGAAPAGYGLGEIIWMQGQSANNIVDSGWYSWAQSQMTEAPFEMGYMLVIARQGNKYVTQIAFNAYYVGVGITQTKIRTLGTDGEWNEWEWVNPPMIPGVEYRTIERHNGKPVYTMVVDCGEVSVGSKEVAVSELDGCTTIRCCGYSNYFGTLPQNDDALQFSVSVTGRYVSVYYQMGMSILNNVTVQIWYTKE